MQHKRQNDKDRQSKIYIYTLTDINFKKCVKDELKADYNTVHHQSIHQ